MLQRAAGLACRRDSSSSSDGGALNAFNFRHSPHVQRAACDRRTDGQLERVDAQQRAGKPSRDNLLDFAQVVR